MSLLAVLIYCILILAKTCRIPPALDTEVTKKRKRKKETPQCKLIPISEFCTKACKYEHHLLFFQK